MNWIEKSLLFFILLLYFSCSGEPELKIVSQKNGPWRTNCYLVYDEVSREAAIIDAGHPVDTLLNHIADNNLKLKYLFITHYHQDHVAGIPEILNMFPEASLCVTRTEYEDRLVYSQWRDVFAEPLVTAWGADSTMTLLMNFDYSQMREPDIFIDDGQELNLGKLTVQALFTPGHSRGSVCYHINNTVFPGDLMMYHSVGYLDYHLASKEDIVASVRKLYRLFPDTVTIYPGHGAISSIGLEKSSNRVVTPDSVKWQ